MRGCMRFLAVLTAIFFVISMTLTLFLFNLARVATDREEIKRAVQSEDLLQETILLVVTSAVQQQADERGLPALEPELLEESVAQLVPPGWMQRQTDAAVDALFDFLEGETDRPEVVIDLAPFEATLRGESGRRVVQSVVESLPVCTPDQLQPAFSGDGFDFPLCVPPGVDVGIMTAQIQESLAQLLDENPRLVGESQVRLSLLGEDVDPRLQRQLTYVQRAFTFSQRWSWLLWLIPLFCLPAIVLLGVRSPGGLGHWLGWPAAVSGGLALITAAAVYLWFYANVLSVEALLAYGGGIGMAMSHFLRAIFEVLVQSWLWQVGWQAGALLAAGGFLILAGFILNWMFAKEETPSPA